METKQSIFVVNPAGDLVRMRPSVPPNEDSLQELIARFPEIIDESEGSLLLIKREQPVSDSDNGGSRWSLDHLFVTRTAIPVLVEVKRASDTRIRREVVGQMLDYAANGVAYWPSGTIANAFASSCEQTGRDPEAAAQSFIGDGDLNEFWAQVDANLRSGRVKLVFVADEIPRELARIVEFLNEQMTADVRAVELRYFEGANGVRTLAPRIIGETERAQAQKSSSRPRLDSISEEEWISKFITPLGDRVFQGFQAALRILRREGADMSVASTQGSIGASIKAEDGKTLYPVLLQKNGTAMIAFGYVNFHVPEGIRKHAFEQFEKAVGPLSTKNANGFPSFPLSRLTDPKVSELFTSAVSEWLKACRASSDLRADAT
jgi:hypothetical protein